MKAMLKFRAPKSCSECIVSSEGRYPSYKQKCRCQARPEKGLIDKPLKERASFCPLQIEEEPLDYEAMESVCWEILDIMRVYDEQAATPQGIDTPGGLEHMGDVWRRLSRWRDLLEFQRKDGRNRHMQYVVGQIKMNNKICGTCIYYKFDIPETGYACENYDSIYHTNHIGPENTCEEWREQIICARCKFDEHHENAKYCMMCGLKLEEESG